jgi:ABC-type lipoprotein release transport system permease subunit
MALGADRARVLTLFVREGLTLTAVGSVLGVAGALAAASLTESLLVGVSARDPLTLALAWLVLTVVSLAACYLPARRASRTNAADVLQRI